MNSERDFEQELQEMFRIIKDSLGEGLYNDIMDIMQEMEQSEKLEPGYNYDVIVGNGSICRQETKYILK